MRHRQRLHHRLVRQGHGFDSEPVRDRVVAVDHADDRRHQQRTGPGLPPDPQSTDPQDFAELQVSQRMWTSGEHQTISAEEVSILPRSSGFLVKQLLGFSGKGLE